jgi:hypothetical protein
MAISDFSSFFSGINGVNEYRNLGEAGTACPYKRLLRETEFRELLEATVEIVYCSAYGASNDAISLK